MKKKILFTIPICFGVFLGLFFFDNPNNKEKLKINSKNEPALEKTITDFSFQEESQPDNTSTNYLLLSQSFLSKAIEISQENKTDELTAERNKKIVQLINEAINAANLAIAQNPQNHQAYAQRAKIYNTVKQYLPKGEEIAIADWQKAISLSNNNAEYCQQLAALFLKKGDLKPAIFYLEKAVETEPNNIALLEKLAKLQIDNKMFSQAQKNYQKLFLISTEKEQKKQFWEKIIDLEKLIAQLDQNDLENNYLPPEIALPDSPPLLEAQNLAKGPIIAAPEESLDKITSSSNFSSNSFSGEETIPAGQTEVLICNANLTPSSQVYLTSEKQGQVIFVKKKAPQDPETNQCSHFVVAIPKPLEKDLKFKWWVIN